MVDSLALGTDDMDSVRSGIHITGNKSEYSNSEEGDPSFKQQHPHSSDPEALIDEYISKRFPSDSTNESAKKYEYEIIYVKIKKNLPH